jgi:predicted CopG family antitoxin
MPKKLTIIIDSELYDGLYRVAGRRHISKFIEEIVRPYVRCRDLEAAYKSMSQDESRETEALEWAEATVGDAFDETR